MGTSAHTTEELSWLKVVFTVVVALDASLIAWLARRADASSVMLAAFAAFATIGLSAILALTIARVYRCLSDLEG